MEVSLNRIELQMAIYRLDVRQGFIQNLFWDPEGM